MVIVIFIVSHEHFLTYLMVNVWLAGLTKIEKFNYLRRIRIVLGWLCHGEKLAFTKSVCCYFVSDVKCCRNKATAMIKEMSAMTMGNLAKRMQKLPYSIATDGSNEADKKQFPLVVTIQGDNGLVQAELLALPVCTGSATGEFLNFVKMCSVTTGEFLTCSFMLKCVQ